MPLEDHRGEAIAKVVIAVIWIAVAAVSFFSLRTLETVPDTAPAAK
jgi:hypothetical protein